MQQMNKAPKSRGFGYGNGCQYLGFEGRELKACGRPPVAACIVTKLQYCSAHVEKMKTWGPLEPLRKDLFEPASDNVRSAERLNDKAQR
jgi:hypothetical protein